MARKAASAARTFVYSLRAQGVVAARTGDEEPRVLASRGGAVFGVSYAEPYGLAYGEGKKTLWVADKPNHAVWALRIPASGSATVKEKLHSAEARGPCMLDVHSKHGLLVGCYGDCVGGGSVSQHDGERWTRVTPADFRDRVTHCCWLPDGGYCYVTRSDSVLWYAKGLLAPAVPLTQPGKRELSPPAGPVGQLRLRYVQGLRYSTNREALLVADASLGAIYQVDPTNSTFELLVGRPALSDSTLRTDLSRDPRSDTWLGPVRALVEDEKGRVLWVNGEDGVLYAFAGGKVTSLGSLLPEGCEPPLVGSGLTLLA
jgi:hypothetical protein